jgi:hypothetical protein
MASDHLVFQIPDDVFRGESTAFRGNLAVKNDLVQEIAEFLADLRRVSLIERVQEFMAFFQEERS